MFCVIGFFDGKNILLEEFGQIKQEVFISGVNVFRIYAKCAQV